MARCVRDLCSLCTECGMHRLGFLAWKCVLKRSRHEPRAVFQAVSLNIHISCGIIEANLHQPSPSLPSPSAFATSSSANDTLSIPTLLLHASTPSDMSPTDSPIGDDISLPTEPAPNAHVGGTKLAPTIKLSPTAGDRSARKPEPGQPAYRHPYDFDTDTDTDSSDEDGFVPRGPTNHAIGAIKKDPRGPPRRPDPQPDQSNQGPMPKKPDPASRNPAPAPKKTTGGK
ncbi:hypothetical protein C8Q77DRAFT_61630 [Trametes polyzona]|nr:hypothetical protein C8Q77DRAFT_61630 [Trametes polyzona]